MIDKLFSKLSKKFTCPYCYAEHCITECGLRCSYNVIGQPDKKCKFDIKKYDDTDGTRDWIPLANKKKCLDCKEATQHIFCPIYKDKEIPIEFLSMKSLPIALLGAKASGKSNYIGVLVNEIRKTMTGPFNCSLSLVCSQESKKAYDQYYYKPLFIEGYTASATTGAVIVPPMIFPLRFMNDKKKIVNMTALTFYDTAGENLDDDKVMQQFNRYITNAKGIILLLDPLQVPVIRKKLTANGFTDLPAENTEINIVLSRIYKLISDMKKVKDISIPLALVFTKIDVLEQYNILPPDSCLKTESEHVNCGSFVKYDFENTNIQMKDLIENWLDDELIRMIDHFKYHSFFGVTALGGSPIGDKIDKNGIQPRRVLDPLLWLLAENKYIKTTKK